MITRHIALLAYPSMTALDLIGPHHVLSMVPNVKVHIVARTPAPITTDLGLVITPDTTFDDCPQQLEVLFAPGGTAGTVAAMEDDATLDFFRTRGQRSAWVTSVCTGALILGSAGLLRGRSATTHWSALPLLTRFGATPLRQRVVQDGHVVTGAGVTAGLDFGLLLAARLSSSEHARKIQLLIEYDPEPPFDSGSPARASASTVASLQDSLTHSLEAAAAVAGRQAIAVHL